MNRALDFGEIIVLLSWVKHFSLKKPETFFSAFPISIGEGLKYSESLQISHKPYSETETSYTEIY